MTPENATRRVISLIFRWKERLTKHFLLINASFFEFTEKSSPCSSNKLYTDDAGVKLHTVHVERDGYQTYSVRKSILKLKINLSAKN